jgi:hypothetical protein
MGFLDGIMGGGDAELRRAREAREGVNVPTNQDLQLILEQLVQTGVLRPEEIPTVEQGESAYTEISADPRLRGSQTRALDEYEAIASANGLDARARAGLEDALETQRTETRGARERIMADARARGQGGSDMALVNELVAQQGAAQRGSRAALDTAAIGEQRKMDALNAAAQLATGVRQQDRNEAENTASAVDSIRRYNAQNAQSVAGENVRSRNVAQATNLGEQQRIGDANVGIRNQNREYQAELPLTLYKLRRGQAEDKAAGYEAQAAAEESRNARIAQLATAAAMFAASDKRVKQDVEEVDSHELLDELSAESWRYKGALDDGERHVGVMAQDMEQSPMADAVSEAPDGTKMIDYGPEGVGMPPDQLAILVSLSKRIDRLEGRGAEGGRARG